MSELLKFEDVSKRDVLISPWGTEVTCVGESFTIFEYAVRELSTWHYVPKEEFEAIFGGWRVKDDV